MGAAHQPLTNFARKTAYVVARTGALIVAGLCFVGAMVELRKIGTPNAPIAWVYIAIAVSVVTLALQLPLAFDLLPRRGKLIATLMLAAPIITLAVEASQMDPAWSATAGGQREAAARSREQQAAAQVQQAEDAVSAERRYEDDLDGCFSLLGHGIPALTSQVKDSMENPSSFQYVRTDRIGNSTTDYNVGLTFRAENGFGAIRTGTVQAKINPVDCSIQSVGQPID